MRSWWVGVAIAAAWGAAAAGAQTATESSIRMVDHQVRLSSEGGLRLVLDAHDGSAQELHHGGRTLRFESAPLVHFEEVVEAPGVPDLLEGMSAEAWGMAPEALEGAAEGQAGPWLRLEGDVARARRIVVLDQVTPQPLILSGWCQARVSAPAVGWWSRSLALNATGTYADGTRLPEVSAFFGQYQHGPQFNRCVICPDRPLKEVEIELTTLPGESTAWYRDVQFRPAQYRVTVPRAPLKRVDACLIQEFDSPTAGLRSWVTFQPMADGIEIRGILESTRLEDRSVSAYVTLPFDAVGGRWHDHFRASRTIEAGRVYRDEAPQWYYGAGRDGRNSVYPLACVDAPNGPGLAVAVPPDEPRLFQAEYDAAARALRVRFDLGLSPDAGRHANRATFTARLFPYDVADGFRGAAERYHRMFPWAFTKRVAREGTWLAFLSPSFVPGGAEDFHFQFIEAVGNMGWEEQQGMYSLLYILPHVHVHEFPGHIEAPEVHGPALPEASLALAERIPALEGLPLEMYRRYRAYPGAYAADKWGQPNGFFFRTPEGGRNENMMILHADPDLPPPPGAPFSHAGYERETIRETLGIARQWHVPGWKMQRVTPHSFFEIDGEQAAEGKQSLRLDVVESKNYFEQHLRGLSQDVYVDVPAPQPVTLSLQVRCDGDHVAEDEPQCTLTFWDPAGRTTSQAFPLGPLDSDWRTFTFATEVPAATAAITLAVNFARGTYRFNPLRVWLDDVTLTVSGGPNLLQDGGFEEAALLPCRLDGLYLDIIEGYWGDLNYRRDHWRHTDVPLTFDTGRHPALLQVHSHTLFTRQMAHWLHPQDLILFGNCAPTTPFTAPYLDVLGDEQFWKQGGNWTPKSDAWFNFARFMSRAKPYNILQYSDLSVEEQTRYVKRCLFYGMFPSNQADPEGQWFWANPVAVARHRPVFRRYVPFIIEVAQAGWQPLTLAGSDNELVWLERFGEGDTLYLTVFNPDSATQSATVTLDARAGVSASARIEERLNAQAVTWLSIAPEPSFAVVLEPEDVAVFRISKE